MRGSTRLRRILLPLAFGIVCLTLWEAVTRWFQVSSTIIVPPSVIAVTLADGFSFLSGHMLLTTLETVEGFALAAVCGIALGTVITLSRRVRQALYPNILFFQLIPKIALAPLFIVWLGVGAPSILAFAVFLAFFPIALSTAAGLISTNRDVVRLCRSLTATPWQIFRHVRLPFAMPYVFAGLKVGMTMAMIGVIVGEFVTAQAGLGYLIMFASSAGESAMLFAALTLLCAIGLVLYSIVALAELLVQRRFGAPVATTGAS